MIRKLLLKIRKNISTLKDLIPLIERYITMLMRDNAGNIKLYKLQLRNLKTRMTTSISSKALPTDRRTKYLQNRCSFLRGFCTKKNEAISQLGTEKITFPPKRG